MKVSFLSSLLLTLLSMGGVVVIPLLFLRRLRENLFFYVPVGITLQFLFAGIMACLTYHLLPMGWGKTLVVYGGGALFVFVVLYFIEKKSLIKKPVFESPKILLWIAFLAFIACSDLLLIFARNGWGFDDGSLWPHVETYFRAPLNSDNERNTLLITALIRGSDSPLLPHTGFSYQLFWFHLFAPLVSLYKGLTLFQVTQGIAFANALLFFFCLFVSLLWLRPKWMAHRGSSLLLALFFSSHADLYHLMASYLTSGRPGIEADWSMIPVFFRNFSLKMLALTSPQHLTVLWFGMAYLVFPSKLSQHSTASKQLLSSVGDLFRIEMGRKFIKQLFFIGGFLFSPVMSMILFPLIWVGQMTEIASSFIRARGGSISKAILLRENPPLRMVSFLLNIVSSVIISLVFYHLLLGSPWELFQRPGVNRLVFFQGGWQSLMKAPIFLVGALGCLGLVTTLLLAYSVRVKSWKKLVTFYPVILLGGGMFFHYVVTSLESRRHVAMIFSLFATLFVAKNLPPLKKIPKLASTILMLVTLGLHSYYLYCFVGKPTSVPPEIAWEDYFKIGKVIERQFPGLATLAATEPFESGIIFSPINEFTTSLPFGGHVLVHSRLNDFQLMTLSKIRTLEDIPPLAHRLGFQAIVWGPAEDMIWGSHIKERFIDQNRKIASIGKVSLYQLGDNLENELKESKLWFPPLSSEAKSIWYLKRGQYFEKKKWPAESLENFEWASLALPNNPEAQFGLGKSYANYRRYDLALTAYDSASELGLESSELNYQRGVAHFLLNQLEKAELFLRRAMVASPNDDRVQLKLVAVLLKSKKQDEAYALVNQALRHQPKKPELLAMKAKIESLRGDFLASSEVWQQILLLPLTPQQRFEANFGFGLIQVQQGNLENAKSAFEAAVVLSPKDILSRRYLSDVWRALGEEDQARTHAKLANDLEDKQRILREIEIRSK